MKDQALARTTSSQARVSPKRMSSSRPHALSNQALQRHVETGRIHGTLKIGSISDPQEDQADRAAERITSGARPEGLHTQIHHNGGGHTRGIVSGASVLGIGAGRPLDAMTRMFFETHFGDLSNVRVHDDAKAGAVAASLTARAYTAGPHIGFAPGEYAPASSEGRKLLAHELAHVAQGGDVVRRQPATSDSPVRGRVSRRDIASYGAAAPDWHSQFEPQKPPVDPTDVSSIEEAQAWVEDLSGFTMEEKRRLQIGSHLKSMIERLPPEVWLPSNDIISQSHSEKDSLIVTGARGPFDTENLRNKLYSMYLSVERPEDIKKAEQDPTGLIFDFDIEQFVTEDEKAAAERFGLAPDVKPFHLSRESFTHRDIAILEFMFADEMLEWRRRDVELQDSVAREKERRIGVFMAALGDVSLLAIKEFFKFTALAGIGMAAAPGVAGAIGSRLGVGAGGLSTAGWGTRFIVGTGTGEVIGAGTGALERVIENAPELVTGEMSVGDYVSDIGSGAWGGAKMGALFGAGGEIAAPFLRGFWNLIRPGSKPPVSAPGQPVPPAPKTPIAQAAPDLVPVQPRAVPGTTLSDRFMARMRELVARAQLGLADAAPSATTIGAGSSSVPAQVMKAPAASAASPVPKPVTELSAPAPAVTAKPATKPMRKPPGGGRRTTMTSTEHTTTAAPESKPVVQTLPRSSEPLPEPEYWADPSTPIPTPVKRVRADARPWLDEQLGKVSDPAHPLHKALVVKTASPDGSSSYTWRTTTFTTKKGAELTGRFEGSEEGITIQVGHREAFASGKPERYMIEDADLNQLSGQAIESKGAFSIKETVLVGPPGKEVPVDLASLQQWERLGEVPSGTVAKAKKAD